MDNDKEIYTQMRKCLHEIAGETGIVMAYVNATTQIKMSGDFKTMCENSISSLYKIREEINRMRSYVEIADSSDHDDER